MLHEMYGNWSKGKWDPNYNTGIINVATIFLTADDFALLIQEMKDDPENCLLSEHEDRYWIGPSPAVCFEPRPKRQPATVAIRYANDPINRDVSADMEDVRKWLDERQIKWTHERRSFEPGGFINDTIVYLHALRIHISEHAQYIGNSAIVFGTMMCEVLYPSGGKGFLGPTDIKFENAKDIIIQKLQKILNCMEP